MIIHWNACLFFSLAKFTNSFDLKTSENISGLSGELTFIGHYVSSFYRSTLQLTTISNIPSPRNSIEKVYMTLNYLLGVLVFAVIVGSVTEIIDDLNMKRREFQKRVDGVKNYMELANVNKEIQERVIKWFNHAWAHSDGMDEQQIFQELLPENLQAEVAINIHLDTLKRVHIFQDCEAGLLQQLVTKLKLQVFSPGDFICKKGDIGREMYFIKSGKLNVVSEDGSKVFAVLSEGSYFGEISILDIPGSVSGNRRTANVRSVGYSDLFCLTKADLWHALVEFPLAKKVLIEKGKSLLRKDNLIDEQAIKKAEELEKINENLDENLNGTKIKIDQIEKRISSINELIKSGMNMLESRIDNLEHGINSV